MKEFHVVAVFWTSFHKTLLWFHMMRNDSDGRYTNDYSFVLVIPEFITS